jgi:hypothetical protein
VLCFSQKVKVEYDRGADFSQYRAYAWAGQDLEGEPPIAVFRDFELFDDRLKNAVNQHMWEKGFVLVTDEKNADLVLAYHVTIDLKSSQQDIYENSPMTNTQFNPVWQTDMLEGTLILDMLDQKTQELVWRATSSAAIKPEKQEKRIKNATKKMFRTFPPKKK